MWNSRIHYISNVGQDGLLKCGIHHVMPRCICWCPESVFGLVTSRNKCQQMPMWWCTVGLSHDCHMTWPSRWLTCGSWSCQTQFPSNWLYWFRDLTKARASQPESFLIMLALTLSTLMAAMGVNLHHATCNHNKQNPERKSHFSHFSSCRYVLVSQIDALARCNVFKKLKLESIIIGSWNMHKSGQLLLHSVILAWRFHRVEDMKNCYASEASYK